MERNVMNTSTLVATIGGLRVGESVTYPLERAHTVKTSCSSYGMLWNKKFKTKIDREARTITVTRVRMTDAGQTK